MTDCKYCRGGFFERGSKFYFGQDVECVNGVLIDIDEAHEGPSDVEYALAPCHPNYKDQKPNDSIERLEQWRGIAPPPDGETRTASATGSPATTLRQQPQPVSGEAGV